MDCTVNFAELIFGLLERHMHSWLKSCESVGR